MSQPHPPMAAVRAAVSRALEEDLSPLGDLTTGLLPAPADVVAFLVPRSEGVLAGTLCTQEAFCQVDPSVRVTWRSEEGEEVDAGQVVAQVEGNLSSILTAERTALNFLGHLSGVATLTRRFVRATYGQARVRDTRKTTPGLRALEKAAVRAGGGVNHRGSLSDGILLKDNHMPGLGIDQAVARARLHWPGRSVEVECDTVEQVEQAAGAGADMVLLDNMDTAKVSRCVLAVAGRCLVEVSGGIDLDSVRFYAEAGVDFVSVGAITHSAPVLDIGLDLEAPG